MKVYKSIDTIINTEDSVHFKQEFLNSFNPSGFPSYYLELKVGTPVILMRNLNPFTLCNDTKLQIKSIGNNIIEIVIITGPFERLLLYSVFL